jgi:hypothetical protein
MTDRPVADHPFHDEWRFQRTMTRFLRRLRELRCVVGGHRVAWGPCDSCGRRARG